MKLLVLVNADGTRWNQSAPVPDEFDTQAWAERRRASFKLLGVIKIEERYMTETTPMVCNWSDVGGPCVLGNGDECDRCQRIIDQEQETCVGCGKVEALCECAQFDSERK